jgi:hypothetical protein
MKEIMVGLSPRQKTALRKGLKVRLKGGDIPLYVEPNSFDRFSKSFLRGKGIQYSMSPAEIAHNEGMGILGKAKKMGSDTIKGLKKGTAVAKTGFEERVAPKLKQVGQSALNMGKKTARLGLKYGGDYFDELGATAGAAAAVAAGNPELAPITSVMGREAGRNLAEQGNKHMDLLRTHKQRANQPRSRGPSQDPIAASSRGNLAADLAAASIDSMRYRQQDDQAPSPLMRGSGIHEIGTIGRYGTLLTDPVAIMPQPYSANFQFRSTLPPAYQNISKNAGGRGLYASGGSGLYATPQSARGLYAGSLGAGLYAGGQGLYA